MEESRVYDLGYQRYAGPREGRSRARKALFTNGVRLILGIGRGGRSKILPGLLFLGAIVPALIFVIVLSVAEPAASSLPGPADYYQITTVILILFGAISAPELLCSDRRDNVIHLYLVRPLTTNDYLIGRFLAFFVIVLALVYSGQIILQAGLILSSPTPLQYIQDNWEVVPKFLLAGLIVAIFITSWPLAITTFTTRRVYVASAVIGIYLITTSIADGLTSLKDCPDTTSQDNPCVAEYVTGDYAKWYSLLSIRDVPIRINNMIFEVEQTAGEGPPAAIAGEELHGSIHIIIYLLMISGPILLLWLKYRNIRA